MCLTPWFSAATVPCGSIRITRRSQPVKAFDDDAQGASTNPANRRSTGSFIGSGRADLQSECDLDD